MRTILAVALVGAAVVLAAPAGAEVGTVRISKQYGLPYPPMSVIEEQKLIEKQARQAGLGEIIVTWNTAAGPAEQLDAILAGQIDFIGPGVTTLATVWDKTVGTPQEIRALGAMQSMPYMLVPQPERQDDCGLHRHGQDRAAGREADRPCAGARNGGGAAVGRRQIR
jgi:NitT/TauT family transport system substrate-binding protein